MTAPGSRSPEAVREPEPGPRRLVLDVEFALDEVVADLIRDELAGGGRVHVVLLLPRLGWSTDPALVATHGRRIAQTRERRIEDLVRIAGGRSAQVTISLQRRRWRRPQAGQTLSDYDTHDHAQEGIDQ